MVSKTITISLNGSSPNMVYVEVDISGGLPNFNIVGLANTSVKESKERVKSAIINSGYDFPVSKIIVNLSPADIKKEGTSLDLPIALAILEATGQIPKESLKNFIIIGELSLLGTINKVRGALPITLFGLSNNISNFIVPNDNKEECTLSKDANIYCFNCLKEVVGFCFSKDLMPYTSNTNFNKVTKYNKDFSQIKGQESCKRAIEVATAGNHNIMLFGPPGSGKSMMAERIPTILPPLNYEESLDITKIYSIAAKLDKNTGLIKERPFRNPHSTTSKIALVGGGCKLMPGEISLAHNGVLFLDEILEFKKSVLEVLRQPLEDKIIHLSRYTGSITYPCNFMLVSSLNPCPCGFYGSTTPCRCSDYERKRYLNKLSGPFLTRMDIFSFVSSLSYEDMTSNKKSESSDSIRKRILKARLIQKDRFKNSSINNNSQMKENHIKKFCKLDSSATSLLEKMYNQFNLSARSYCRILKVARTIADLNQNKNIQQEDLIEALHYRKFIDEKII